MPDTFNTGFTDPLAIIAGKWFRQMNGGTPEEGANFANPFASGQGSAYGTLQSETGDLKSYLGGVLGEGAVPAGAMGNIQRNASRVTNRNINTLREGSAQSGFRGVVNPNAVNDVYANEEGFLGNAELDLMKMQYARKSDAVAQLLGIAGMGQSAIGQDRSSQLNLMQMMQSGAMGMDQLQAQKDATPSPLGQVAGNLLNTAGSVATASIMMSDRDLKEKIVYTGETHDGVPLVQFNYKGSPIRYEGVIAQDIEDMRPDCVTIFEDGQGGSLRTVDYNKLGIQFRRVN